MGSHYEMRGNYERPPEGFVWAMVPGDHLMDSGPRLSKYDTSRNDIRDYVYYRLEDLNHTIRVLKLMAGGKMDMAEVRCQLVEGTFRDGKLFDRETRAEIEYEALSWCWGAEDFGYQILIEEGDDCYRYRTSEALVRALKCLQQPGKTRFLWIDALCIDLNDVEERNYQVQLMSVIYSAAKRVCVWLGPADETSRIAISFVKEILQLQNFDEICEDERNTKKWQSLLLLMQRPLFSRRWVVQEIALARDARLYCGEDEISWRDFSIAIELFVEVETATHRLSEVMKKDPKFYHVLGWFEYVSALGASLLVQATGMVFRRYKDKTGASPNQGLSRRPLLSLEYLVSYLTVFDNRRQHDAIYALLAIAKDTNPIAVRGLQVHSLPMAHQAELISSWSEQTRQTEFPVNYERPYTDVCKDFIEFCLGRSDPTRALDIICRPWAPAKDNEYTTIPPTTESESQGFSKSFQKRLRTAPPRILRYRIGSMNGDNSSRIVDTPSSGECGTIVEQENTLPQNSKVLRYYPWQSGRKQSREQRETMLASLTDQMDLPSWIPQLSNAPFALIPHAGIHIHKMGRVNADPLVGLPIEGQRTYNAAQTMAFDKKTLRFRKRLFQADNHYSMYAKGFRLDLVAEVRDASQAGAIPREWTELAGWESPSCTSRTKQSEVPEEFWRTIIADRGKDGQNPPHYYAKACEESVEKGGIQSGAVNTSDLINNERSSIVAQFCRRVQEVIWNRCLIKTQSGHLGLARKGVQKGDLVCILYGCSVPVILREKQKTEEDVHREREEDMFADLEKAVKAWEQSRDLKKKRRERQDMAVRKQKEGGKDGEWVRNIKHWGRDEILSYVKEWNELGDKLKEVRAEKEKIDARVKQYEDQQRRLRNPTQMAQGNDHSVRHWYIFLGECYVHSMMDGEAMQYKQDKEIPDYLFELR